MREGVGCLQVVGHVDPEQVEGGGGGGGGGSGGCGSGDSRSPLSDNEIAAGWSEDIPPPPTPNFTTLRCQPWNDRSHSYHYELLFFFFVFFFNGGDGRLCPLPESGNGQAVFIQVEWH